MIDLKPRIIALDLDGTLLNSEKKITPRTYDALQRASERGVEIVPSTGRFYTGMPQAVRDLPFLHYAITINGSRVFDLRTGEIVYKSEIPFGRALEIMELLDRWPIVYDCYMDDQGWMTASMKGNVIQYTTEMQLVRLVRDLRQSVPELKQFLRDYAPAHPDTEGVQKISVFAGDEALRKAIAAELNAAFSDIVVSSSMATNLEINNLTAHKGLALWALADHIGVPREATMAFGDGLNDVQMLDYAGIAVAMQNSMEPVFAHADLVAPDNDHDGVAEIIEKIVL
ncbi:MAG: HAD family phosphatase [Ruminococcaceae bacterium]|nr:HAD family phosphatase [Oscillospiraceae bacterium]